MLPDFTYLRERADDIEGIVITHGHEDHLGALPWVLRELGDATSPVYGGPLTMAMARSKLDEHRLKDVELDDVAAGRAARARPVRRRARPHDALDPRRRRRRADLRARHDAHHRRLQVRPDAGRRPPGRRRRLAELGREGLLLLCGDSTNADRPGFSPSESRRRARTSSEVVRRAARAASSSPASRRTSTASSRSSTPPPRTGARSRCVGRSMRKNVNIGRTLGHIEVPDGMLVQPREVDDFPDHKLVIVSTGSQGEPLSALRRMAHNDHPQVELHEGDTVVFSATPIPGNERAVNETIDRLYHIGCDVITAARRADPRLGPRLRGGDQADAQPRRGRAT